MKTARYISLGIALSLVLATGSAVAEKVWTKGTVSLRAEPDSKSRRVARIQANRELSVIEKQGRWYRVKSGAKSGWIHRTNLRGWRVAGKNRDAGSPARNRAGSGASGNGSAEASAGAEPSSESAARAAGSDGDSGKRANDKDRAERRACRKGAVWCDREGDAMRVVVVVSRVKAYKEPREDEDIAFLATQDQELVVIGFHRPSWMYVQTLDGKLGWILKDTVRQKGNLMRARDGFMDAPRTSGGQDGGDASVRASRDSGGDATQVSRARQDEPRSRLLDEPPQMRIQLGMGVGAAVLGRSFAAGGMDQADYETSSTGIVTTVAGDMRYRASGPWHVGLDGNFSMIAAVGGLAYDPGGGDAIEVGSYVQHRTEVSAKAGYDVERFDAYLRAGALVEIFYITDLLNDAALPRERLISPTVGLQLGVRPMDKLEMGLRGDVLLLGSLAQTRGREDGSFDGLFALVAELDTSYALMERVAVQASFRLDQVSPAWTGASVRAPGVNGASRSDRILRALVGVETRF